MSAIFVTGIGTDVGKTVASAVLAQLLDAGYWKPIQAGTEITDLGTIESIRGRERTYPSRYILKTPASPHLAAAIEGLHIELDDFVVPNYSEEHLIVEGAGGLHVPLNDEHLIIDLIKHLDLSVVLVSQNYLGSINHTLLSIEALKQREIPIIGVLFNGEKNRSTEEYITQYAGVSHLGRIEQGDKVNEDFINSQTQNIDYEKITTTY